MLNAKKNPGKVQTALINLILASEAGADWSTIKTHIEARFVVKNWLTEVRGPLQALINDGFIVRCPDVRVERYVPNLKAA